MATLASSLLCLPARRGKPALVRAGSVTVKIYDTAWRDKKRRKTYRSHVVTYRDAGHRRREKHSDPLRAAERAREIANAIASGQIRLEQFTQSDRASYQRAVELLRPTGKTLELAAAEYSQALHLLKGGDGFVPASLLEAVQFYRRQQPLAPAQKTCEEIYKELLLVRAADGAARNTLDDLTSRIGRFARNFQCPITAVTSAAIDDWLTRLNVRRRTRNNYRGDVAALFAFARRRGYIPKNCNPLEDVPRVKNEAITIEVFTPEEITKLLCAAPDNQIPFLAVGAFAGCRHEEMSAPGRPVLDWRQVDLKNHRIRVLATVARKIGHDRIIPMQPNLAAWLQPHVRPNGPICPLANMTNAMLRTARKAGVKWKDNGLRKSFISYRLALVQDIGKVSMEAGNSPDRINHNYRETVDEDEARRWFAIVPTSADILQLPLPLAYA